jgi:large conductance mechanosensitive channel
MIREFSAFLTKTNALALAIGVIIGVAVGKVVSALTDDILMPLITPLLPGDDWREAKIVLSSSVDAAGEVTENAILWGHFLGTVLDFIIIAFVVFMVVRALLRPAPDAPVKTCPECRELIPAAATRCRACTSAVSVT